MAFKFPIEYKELPKFLLNGFMMAIIIYVYSILRASKDTIVVSLMGEAELISALKLYAVLPSAIIFMLIYTKLVHVFSKVQVFHIIVWFFVTFFVVFAFFFYQRADIIHFDFSNEIAQRPYLKYILLIIGKWSYSLFYILSELWGSMLLSLVFWQTANQITSVDESKKFYPLFGLFGQIGFFIAGLLMVCFTEEHVAKQILDAETNAKNWGVTLQYIGASILLSGVMLSSCFYGLTKVVGKDLINGTMNVFVGQKKKKVKLGFFASLKYVCSSKYIGLITLLILCYGISINLVEGLWKKSLGMMLPDANAYANFTGYTQLITAILTAICMVAGSVVLKILRWRTAAILTPAMIAITGLLFFVFMLYRDYFSDYTIAILGTTSLVIAVFSGAAQNILSKAVKYSFFDPTKEASYIPLDDELKSVGKAGADVVGGRLGKSGGAAIQAFLLQVFVGSTLLDLAPYTFAIFLIVMVVWFFAVFRLSTEFEYKIAQKNSSKE